VSLSCAAATSAYHPYGIHVQAGIGLSKADTPDGHWQQAGIPGDSHVAAKPPRFSLGLTGPLLTRGA